MSYDIVDMYNTVHTDCFLNSQAFAFLLSLCFRTLSNGALADFEVSLTYYIPAIFSAPHYSLLVSHYYDTSIRFQKYVHL